MTASYSGAPMADDISTYRERRGLAAAFTLCALASLALLASQPSGATGSFAALLKDEASHQFIDGVEHGGYVVTLVAPIAVLCFCLACSEQPELLWSSPWCASAPAVAS